MKKMLKNLTLFSLVVMIFLSFAGCSLTSKNSGDNAKKQSESTTNGSIGETKIDQDKKNTEKLKKKKEISNGQVYVEKDTVTATMIIKDNVTEDQAKALAESYAKDLKKQYSDKKVNVQAVKNNKNVANITLNK